MAGDRGHPFIGIDGISDMLDNACGRAFLPFLGEGMGGEPDRQQGQTPN
jgi:hypothetical protein